MTRRLTLALLGAALALAGCGGEMKRSELNDSLETIESSAAEAALLGEHAARNRTKTTFVRVRARELGEVLDHEVEKLGDAEAAPGVEEDKQRAIDIASQASAQAGELQATPQDRIAAAQTSERLRVLADRAQALGGGS